MRSGSEDESRDLSGDVVSVEDTEEDAEAETFLEELRELRRKEILSRDQNVHSAKLAKQAERCDEMAVEEPASRLAERRNAVIGAAVVPAASDGNSVEIKEKEYHPQCTAEKYWCRGTPQSPLLPAGSVPNPSWTAWCLPCWEHQKKRRVIQDSFSNKLNYVTPAFDRLRSAQLVCGAEPGKRQAFLDSDLARGRISHKEYAKEVGRMSDCARRLPLLRREWDGFVVELLGAASLADPPEKTRAAMRSIFERERDSQLKKLEGDPQSHSRLPVASS